MNLNGQILKVGFKNKIMEYRNLEELTKIEITKKFLAKFDLKIISSKEGIFFENENLILHVYGFYIEDILYFDFYTKNLEKKINSDLIIEIFKLNDYFKNYYEEITLKHLLPITTLINANNFHNTISAEFDYLTYLNVFINKFEEIFRGNFSNVESRFEDTTKLTKENIKYYLKTL